MKPAQPELGNRQRGTRLDAPGQPFDDFHVPPVSQRRSIVRVDSHNILALDAKPEVGVTV
jgi:hypothetical protein